MSCASVIEVAIKRHRAGTLVLLPLARLVKNVGTTHWLVAEALNTLL